VLRTLLEVACVGRVLLCWWRRRCMCLAGCDVLELQFSTGVVLFLLIRLYFVIVVLFVFVLYVFRFCWGIGWQ